MKRRMNWAVAPIFGMLLFTLGCVDIDPAEAQKALEVGRQMRELQAEGARPLMTSLDELRGGEMEPFYFQMEELSRQQEAIYRERIMPLEQQLNGVYPDDSSFSIQQDEFDAQMREINQLERRLEAESWQLDKQRRRQELEVRVESEDAMRVKQDVIEELRQQLHDLYRTGQRTLDELYRKQSELYSGYTDPYYESDEAVFLREELAEIEWKITNSQSGFDDLTSALEQEISSLEAEVALIYTIVDEQEMLLASKIEALETLYIQLEELRLTITTVVKDTAVQVTTVSDETQIAFLGAEIAALEGEIAMLTQEFDANWTLEQSLVAQMDALYQEVAFLADSVMDEGSLYGWMEEITASLNNLLLIQHSAAVQALQDELAVIESQIAEIEATFQDQAAVLEHEIAVLEEEIAQLQPMADEADGAWHVAEEELGSLYHQLEELYHAGTGLEETYARTEEIEVLLAASYPDSDTWAPLQTELSFLEALATEVEAAFQAEVSALEELISVLEAEVVGL